MGASDHQASDIQGRPMNRPLRDRRALVTGGSRGIGAAIVRRLARDGAHVALTYVSRADRGKETAEAARALSVKAMAITA
jgi:3-oxoacyl-[acyl-carrier protein] reductase